MGDVDTYISLHHIVKHSYNNWHNQGIFKHTNHCCCSLPPLPSPTPPPPPPAVPLAGDIDRDRPFFWMSTTVIPTQSRLMTMPGMCAHSFVSRSYLSTEDRKEVPSYPPATYRKPSSTVHPSPLLGFRRCATVHHWFRLGIYLRKELRRYKLSYKHNIRRRSWIIYLAILGHYPPSSPHYPLLLSEHEVIRLQFLFQLETSTHVHTLCIYSPPLYRVVPHGSITATYGVDRPT